MQRFKVPFALKFTLIFVLMVGSLTGCLEADKKSDEQLRLERQGNVSSTFEVNEIEGESEVARTHDAWKFPLQRYYVYKACLKERVTKAKLPGGQIFTVEFPSDEHQRVETDENGCLIWNDLINYNYFADSTYIERKFTLMGTGIYKGKAEVRVAVNPWKEDRKLQGEEVRDLRYHPLPPTFLKEQEESQVAFQGLDEEGYVKRHNLWVDQVNLETFAHTMDDKGGLQETTITFKPRYEVKDHLGQKTWPVIEQGQFRITAEYYLVQKNGEGAIERTLLGKYEATEAEKKKDKHARWGVVKKGRDGYVRAVLPIRISHLAKLGQLEIGVRIQPYKMGHMLNTFEGVFLVGQPDRILSSGTARLREFVRDKYPRFDLEDWKMEQGLGTFDSPKSAKTIQEKLDKYKKALAAIQPGSPKYSMIQKDVEELEMRLDGIYELTPLEFSEVKPKFIGVKDCETSAERTIQFRVRTCIKDPRTGDGLQKSKFRITAPAENGFSKLHWENVAQRSDGCLSWIDEVTHKYYKKERYFARTVQVEHIKSGAKETASIVINPWDWGWTFGQETKDLGLDYFKSVNDNKKIESKLIIYNFRYETVGFRYEIDDFMTLKVIKSLLLRFDPRVMRYSSITQGINKNEPLRDGAYLMKVGIQKNYETQSGEKHEFLSVFEDIVRVRGGVVIQEIEVDVRDLRLMRIRDHFLIELIPINEKKIIAKNSCDFTEDFKLPEGTNYDKLRLDPDEYGLAPRTFIGPIIPLTNYFSAGLRPTDNLKGTKDEPLSEISDLEEVSKVQEDLDLKGDEITNLEKVYQSMNDFKDVTVTDLFRRYHDLENKFEEDIERRSRFDRWATRYGTDYVQLYNPELRKERFNDPKKPLESINVFAPVAEDQGQAFVDDLNTDHFPQSYAGSGFLPIQKIEMKDIHEMLLTGHMSRDLANRMCRYWFAKVLPTAAGKRFQEYFPLYTWDRLKALVRKCTNDQLSEPRETGQSALRPFEVDRRIKVHDLGEYEYARGMSMNLQVGANVRISHNTDSKINVNQNVRPLKWLLDGVFGFVQSIFGVDYSINFSHGDGESRNMSHGTNSGTYLVIQMAKFDVTFDQYEHCVSVAPSGDYWRNVGIDEYLHKDLTRWDRFRSLSRGLFMCSGEVESEPLTLRETFYYFAQHFVTGDLLDLGDPRNHPWLLALRGYKDYTNFIDKMKTVEMQWLMQNLDEAEGDPSRIGEIADDLGIKLDSERSTDEQIEQIKRTQLARMNKALRLGLDGGTKSKGGLITGFVSPEAEADGRDAKTQLEIHAEQTRSKNASYYGSQLGAKGSQRFQNGDEAEEIPLGAPRSENGKVQQNNSPDRIAGTWAEQREALQKFYSKRTRDFTWKELEQEYYDKAGYELYNFPHDHTGLVYQGTFPSFPGFVTITPESFEVDAIY